VHAAFRDAACTVYLNVIRFMLLLKGYLFNEERNYSCKKRLLHVFTQKLIAG